MDQTSLFHAYDRAAATWGRRVARLGYRAAYESLAAHALAGQTPARVADIGSGTGELARAVCKLCRPTDLLLVDASGPMLARARMTVWGMADHTTTRCARLDDLASVPRFDLVLAGHLIEHAPDPGRALAALADLVAPGGRLLAVISRPHWCQWPIWLVWRHRWFPPATVACMARASGLGAPRVFPLGPGPPGRTSLGYLFVKPQHSRNPDP